jgi:subtilisin family serine protease
LGEDKKRKMKKIITIVLTVYAVASLAQDLNSKFSASLRTKILASDEPIELVLLSSNPNEITSKGFKVRSVIGNIVTVEATNNQLSSLASISSVEYIQDSYKEFPSNISSAQLANVQDVHSGILNNTPLKGEGVIVVIYDSGIDWKHHDFRNQDDTTKSRILFIWDQTDKADATHKSPVDFSYGVEYTNEDINAELSGYQKGFVREKDYTGHGTAIASIAAGNNKTYSGVAPKADIIVIKGGNELFSEAKIIDGLSYAMKKADALQKPIVVNLSLGSQFGAHNGSRMYERAIDVFNSKSGRAVVVAAGNDGDLPLHTHSTVTDSTSFSFTIPNFTPTSGDLNDMIDIEMWYGRDDSVTVTLISPSAKRYSATTHKNMKYAETTEGVILMDNASQGINLNTGMKNAAIQLFDYNTSVPVAGNWKIEVRNEKNSPATFHMWITETHFGNKKVYFDRSSATFNYSITSPGNSTSAITIGSYEVNGEYSVISSFSSVGPRIDGQTKPEVIAVGANVVASSNNSYRKFTGTSFSAPQVAGIVALMLQVDANLTNENVKNILKSSSKLDKMISTISINKRGYGKVDGLNALCQLMKIEIPSQNFIISSAINTVNEDDGETKLLQNYPNPFNPTTTIPFTVSGFKKITLKVYDITGREISKLNEDNYSKGSYKVTFDGSRLSSGTYFVSLESGNERSVKRIQLTK